MTIASKCCFSGAVLGDGKSKGTTVTEDAAPTVATTAVRGDKDGISI